MESSEQPDAANELCAAAALRPDSCECVGSNRLEEREMGPNRRNHADRGGRRQRPLVAGVAPHQQARRADGRVEPSLRVWRRHLDD